MPDTPLPSVRLRPVGTTLDPGTTIFLPHRSSLARAAGVLADQARRTNPTMTVSMELPHAYPLDHLRARVVKRLASWRETGSSWREAESSWREAESSWREAGSMSTADTTTTSLSNLTRDHRDQVILASVECTSGEPCAPGARLEALSHGDLVVAFSMFLNGELQVPAHAVAETAPELIRDPFYEEESIAWLGISDLALPAEAGDDCPLLHTERAINANRAPGTEATTVERRPDRRRTVAGLFAMSGWLACAVHAAGDRTVSVPDPVFSTIEAQWLREHLSVTAPVTDQPVTDHADHRPSRRAR